MTNHKTNGNQKQNNNLSNFKGKLGIVLLGIGILAISVAGYSYFSGPRGSFLNTNQGSCPMMNTTNTKANIQGGGCGMMGNNISNRNNPSSKQNQTTSSVQDQTGPIPSDTQTETIKMNYDDSGLEPSVINLQSGKRYQIVINANTDVYGCMSTITLPGLDDNMQTIRKGKTIVFNVSPTTSGEYDFLCAMGLSHNAKIVVK